QHEDRGSKETRPIATHGRRPNNVGGAIHHLQHNPKPCERSRRPPNVAYRTEIAPKAEGYQRGIKDHESDTRVTEEKTAHKSSRGKNGVQPCEVLLGRMTRLGEDQD